MGENETHVDYEYYPNNFTLYDHPIGVIPKYRYIIQSGLAYVFSGLPERSDYNAAYNTYVVVAWFIKYPICLLIYAAAAWSVRKNKKLSLAVKCFLFIDLFILAYMALNYLFEAQCSINWSCVDPKNNPVWFFINRVWSSTFAALPYVRELLGLGLSTTRVFAVYFNGLYHGKAEKWSFIWMLLAVVLPEAFFIYMIGEVYGKKMHQLSYTGYFYTPLQYTRLVSEYKISWFYDLLGSMQDYGYGVIGLSLLLDLATIYKIRKMVLTAHLVASLSLGMRFITDIMVYSEEPLNLFIIDFVEEFIFPITGTTIFAFNYPWKKKVKTTVTGRMLVQSQIKTDQPSPNPSTTQVTDVE